MAIIKLPHIFSDNMVLQRDKPIKLWGSADKNEVIEINFNNQTKKAKADKSGAWSVTLEALPFGGSYSLKIKGRDNTISLQNILIGDVWLCSGQSNMEMPIHGDWASVNDYQKEMDEANHPLIRAFNINKSMNSEPQKDLEGSWTVCSPQTVSNYSAVAYFFARKLNKELNIPIGIINSSWGGTQIESWISADSFSKLSNAIKEKYNGLDISNFDQFLKENEGNRLAYQTAMLNDRGTIEEWFSPNTNTSSWKKMQIPQIWENVLGDIDGVIWFRYNLTLSEAEAQQAAIINLGPIDDDDVLWINNIKIGETKGYNINRKYTIPAGILKYGENAIVIKISDHSGGGGIYGNADELYIQISNNKYSLSGEWLYHEAVTNKEHNYVNISPNMHHSLLYNAMINPITQLSIKGTIWYQGESNASQAEHYQALFPTLINDWRAKWGYQFPFYWVQLANYMAKNKQPQDSEWASLREAQSLTLALPETGQAVITDIGDANDIHPQNKQDVGLRLALIALNKTYKANSITCSGPTFKAMNIIGDQISIEFDNVAEGLIVENKYGNIEGFSVAGTDKKFEWARAYLDGGNKIIVTCDNISNPVAVRYSWSNNPDVNLFNSKGLPTAPFRTDDW